MEPDTTLVRIRSAGLIALWVVLAVLTLAAAYTASIAVINWKSIGV